jgi:methionine synthase II (cobalamin-independent)
MIKILNLDNIYNDNIPNWYFNIYHYNINNYNTYLKYNNNESQTIKLLNFLKSLIILQEKYEFKFISDCGYKRENNIFYHYRHFNGIEFIGKEKNIFNRLLLNVPLLNNNLYFIKEYLKYDYEILKLFHNKNNIKINSIGPNTFYEFLNINNNNNELINLEEIINNLKYQLLSIINKGCNIIQIDEPYFIYNEKIEYKHINYLKSLIKKLDCIIILGLHNYDEFKLEPYLNEKKLIDLLEINNIEYYSFDYKYIKPFLYLLKKYSNKKYIFKLTYKNSIKEYKILLNSIINDLGHKDFLISPSNFKKTISELDKIYEDLFISVNYINNSNN